MDKKLPRISVKRIRDEVLEVLNLEKGLLFTILSLLRKPLKTVDTYLFKDRSKIFNPFRFIFFSVATYTFLIIQLMSRIDIELLIKDEEDITPEKIALTKELISTALGSLNITILLAIPIYGLLCFLLFDRVKYNYAEHVAINSYIFGLSSWMGSLCFVIGFLFPDVSKFIFLTIGNLLLFLVPIIFYQRIYRKSWVITVLFYFIVYFVTSALISVINFVLFGQKLLELSQT